MNRKQPGEEQLLQRLDSTFTTLDDQRTAQLIRTRTMHSVKDSALKKEQSRLMKKYGAGHPRLKKITNRIDYNQGAFKEMDGEIDRSKITLPRLDVNAWMVHGRVLNREGNGVSGLTLTLCDAKGEVARKLGFACSDELGYYSISYQEDAGKNLLIDEEVAYYLTVSDKTNQLLHREKVPLNVIIGHVDYRLIILADTVCNQPLGWDLGSDDDKSALWSVRGAVVYEDGSPASGLIVSAYDRDLIFDDLLGTTTTNDGGYFSLIYRTDAFRDLIEKNPDLYLKVMDSKGNLLYITKEIFRAEAGKIENFKITLKQ